jgi:hypothetical protein
MPDDLAVTARELEYELAPRALEERQLFFEAIEDLIEDAVQTGAKAGAKGGARSPASGVKDMTKGQAKIAKKDNKNNKQITSFMIPGIAI